MFTMYGISETMICSLPVRLTVSVETRARICTLPRPVLYPWLMPSRPWMNPPVGKSGPGMYSINSSMVSPGRSTSAMRPSMTSLRLCGGMLVAMPTAMPDAPLMSRLGNRDGSTDGSSRESS